jgi:hypothetical protein
MRNTRPERADAPCAPDVARQRRVHHAHASRWLDSVWEDDVALPACNWQAVHALPQWALVERRQLRRIALITGALFAAPALRVCLDPVPLLRMRKLIGSSALDLVLDEPQLQAAPPLWSVDHRTRSAEIYAWSVALMLTGLTDELLRASMARALGATHDSGSPPLVNEVLAARMLERAIAIAHATDAIAAARAPQEVLA